MIEIRDKCPVCVREQGEAKTPTVALSTAQVLAPGHTYPATFVCPTKAIEHGTWTRFITVRP